MQLYYTFEDFGLDVDKNFLVAPLCECGCGSKGNLILKTDQAVRDFCATMLYDMECNHCAIGVIPIKTMPYIAIKHINEEDEPTVSIFAYGNLSDKTDDDYSIFSDFEKECNFHHIGLIMEIDHNLWKIIEE